MVSLEQREQVSEHSFILAITTHKDCKNKVVLYQLGNWKKDDEYLPLLGEGAW